VAVPYHRPELRSGRLGRRKCYCASHSHQLWGLRLHLVTTVHGLPVAFTLINPKVDEPDVLVDLVS
jgi:hypothetical protein